MHAARCGRHSGMHLAMRVGYHMDLYIVYVTPADTTTSSAVQAKLSQGARPLYFLAKNCSSLSDPDLQLLRQINCAMNSTLQVPFACASVHSAW
jgi:hypothetical protein